jgi:predicted aspartyl protease
MNRNRTVVYPCLLFALLLWAAPPATGAYYKYVDRDGRLVFVDGRDKIPMRYRDRAVEYIEPRDRLDAADRNRFDQQEEEKQQAARQRYYDYLETVSRKRAAESAQQDARAETARRRAQETPITIENNQILVPVTLGHQGVTVETRLLLDTGASVITLHETIARKLNISTVMRSKAKVAGGAVIRSRTLRLSQVRVGPLTVKNPVAIVIDHVGPAVSYHGFLGMNILKGTDFRIDFDRKVIRWLPGPETP